MSNVALKKSLEFVYTKLFSKDFKDHMKKPCGFESNDERSILDADSESPTWLAYNIS